MLPPGSMWYSMPDASLPTPQHQPPIAPPFSTSLPIRRAACTAACTAHPRLVGDDVLQLEPWPAVAVNNGPVRGGDAPEARREAVGPGHPREAVARHIAAVARRWEGAVGRVRRRAWQRGARQYSSTSAQQHGSTFWKGGGPWGCGHGPGPGRSHQELYGGAMGCGTSVRRYGSRDGWANAEGGSGRQRPLGVRARVEVEAPSGRGGAAGCTRMHARTRMQ